MSYSSRSGSFRFGNEMSSLCFRVASSSRTIRSSTIAFFLFFFLFSAYVLCPLSFDSPTGFDKFLECCTRFLFSSRRILMRRFKLKVWSSRIFRGLRRGWKVCLILSMGDCLEVRTYSPIWGSKGTGGKGDRRVSYRPNIILFNLCLNYHTSNQLVFRSIWLQRSSS